MIRSNKDQCLWVLWLLLATVVVGTMALSSIHEPLIDEHYFRQTQTALTAYWFNWASPIKSLFYSETPLFGFPWQVPFELPFYQALVSAVSKVSCISISQSGRLVSLFMFILTIPLFGSLAMGLKLGKRFILVSSILWVCSPLYLYWSRTVMIESTAVFFGFVFLAGVERAIASRKVYWWVLAFVASLSCALVKVTTYPAFGLAALGILAWKTAPIIYPRFANKEKLRAILPAFLRISFIGIATIATTSAWTRHADSIKMENSISSYLTSKSLESWNFGTLAQKRDIKNWKQLFNRSIPEAIGSYWVLGFLLVAGCFHKGKKAVLFWGLMVLYLFPMAIFTNLHLVHSYYQYANSFWLVLALGFSVAEMSKRAPKFLTYIVVLTIIAAQLHAYLKNYYPATRLQTTGALEIGKYIATHSEKNQSILVIGDDWSPEVAFHSGRRAVYIPAWLSQKQAAVTFKRIRENPKIIFGSFSPAYIILNPIGLASYRLELRQEIDQLLIQLGKNENSKCFTNYGYDLLQTKMDNNCLRIQFAE